MKTYNPFKMWGSWVGAVAYLIYGMFAWKFHWFDINDLAIILGVIPKVLSISKTTHGLITATIFGFLIGWGIHCLARYMADERE